jgi:hypothetical protein
MKNKNTIWIIGGVALAFVLLNSFTTIKKKQEKKPSGDSAGVPQPQNTPQTQSKSESSSVEKVLSGEEISAPKKDLMPCPEGYNKVTRGGVAGDIFFFCEPKGAKISIMDK